MKESLLKRALPFTLTFLIGAAAGGFFDLLAGRGGATPRRARLYGTYEAGRSCGKFRRRSFAPESRPPIILFKPDAHVPRPLAAGRSEEVLQSVRVSVTFGEDGKVRWALPVTEGRLSAAEFEAAERAARHIQFIPATSGGTPTTVTQAVEIRFSFE